MDEVKKKKSIASNTRQNDSNPLNLKSFFFHKLTYQKI